MSQNTMNNVPYGEALGGARKLLDLKGTTDFIEDRLSPDNILHSGFHQGNGNYGATGQRRFLTEQDFATVMASKDIYIFGSHSHQVFRANYFCIILNC
jgi:hypothetical protein